MRKGGTSRSVAPRLAGLVLIICAGFLSVGCGGDPDDTTAAGSTTSQAATGGGGSSNGGLTQDEAYEMAVKGMSGDPAVTEGLDRGTFDALSRLTCESLKDGSSVQRLVDDVAQQPTSSGMPMRRESAEKLIAAGVRGYCPEFASQLP